MASRFHEEALQRLAKPYQGDPDATRALEERARRLGITMPASFAEWYGMSGGIDLLRKNSNCDEPIKIERLGDPFDWRWDETRDLIREGLLLFMVENQSVSVWALRLDGSDDPPVVVARDPDLEWRSCAQRFSTFIACQVWDHTEVFDDTGSRILLQAQASTLRDIDLAFLRQQFEERPATGGWPGDHQYRFERGDARLLIWDGEYQVDWLVAATSEGDLTELTRELWTCGDLASSLWSNDARGEAVLRTLRSPQRADTVGDEGAISTKRRA